MKKNKYGMGIVAITIATFTLGNLATQAGEEPAPVEYTEAEASSFYLSGFGGVNWAQDFSARASRVNLESEQDVGYLVGGALGYDMPVMGGLRFEIEGAYRSNDVDSVRTNGKFNQGEGEISAWSVMFNIAKDMPLSDRLSLYVGGGVGIAGLDADFAYGSARVNEKDEVFAWQVFAGVSFEVATNFEIYTEYRFFQAVDPEFSREVRGSSSNLEGDSYESHGLLFGARIHF